VSFSAHARAAAPFFLKRSEDIVSVGSVTSTTETIHGLLRLDGERLVVQWRLERTTERVGTAEIRTDRELEEVREVVLPLASVAGARVRRPRWLLGFGARLVLQAADLRAFDVLAGPEGLKLDHPAELVLRLRRKDLLTAEEFAAELALAVAQLEEPRALEEGGGGRLEGERGSPSLARPGSAREPLPSPPDAAPPAGAPGPSGTRPDPETGRG
jgi:hypothetical protein